MRRILLFIVAISVALAVLTAPAISARAEALDTKAIDTFIDQMMTMYGVPGLSMALVQDGKVIYAKGYGYRDVSKKLPVTENTLFAIGSVTKSFTSLGIMELVNQGKLDLDKPITTYVPDVKLATADLTQKMTLRYLLSMSSGLPRDDIGWYTGKYKTRQEIIDAMQEITPTADLGKVFQYCNQNFVLAGYIIEKITGQPWEAYTKANILDKLGLKSANFADEAQQTSDFAAPHGVDILTGYVNIPFFKYIKLVGPAGSINASAVDMGKYIEYQIGDGSGLVTADQLKVLHTGTIPLASGAEGKVLELFQLTSNQAYAMGWISEKYRDLTVVSHDGAIDGFNSSLSLVPDKKVGVWLVANIGNATPFLEATRIGLIERLTNLKLTENIAEVLNKRLRDSGIPALARMDPVTRQKDWDKAKTFKGTAADFAPYMGDYNGPNGKITLYMKGDQVRVKLEISLGQDLALVPIGPDEFLVNEPQAAGIKISLKKQTDGIISMLQDGTEVAKRVPAGATTSEYSDPKGKFSLQIPVELITQQVGDLLAIQSANPPATFFATARKATSDRFDVQIKAWANSVNAPFDFDPKSSAVQVAGERNWTLFRYELPGNQLLLVGAFAEGETLYIVGAQGLATNVTYMSDTLLKLLNGFKTTK